MLPIDGNCASAGLLVTQHSDSCNRNADKQKSMRPECCKTITTKETIHAMRLQKAQMLKKVPKQGIDVVKIFLISLNFHYSSAKLTQILVNNRWKDPENLKITANRLNAVSVSMKTRHTSACPENQLKCRHYAIPYMIIESSVIDLLMSLNSSRRSHAVTTVSEQYFKNASQRDHVCCCH